MAESIPTPPHTQEDHRASLVTRVIPTMTLSDSNNPLTAPLVPYAAKSPSERASGRFAVSGNAAITGGAGTLALVSARALLEHGVSSLTLFDLPSTIGASSQAINKLRSDFPDTAIHTISVDVTSAEDIGRAFERAHGLMSSIDILCCFAGIVGCVHSISAASEQFKRVVDVNLTGSFLCAQAAARYMIDSGRGGSILFTTSMSGHMTNYPQPQAAYNVSKAGLAHLTKNLAAEWAVHGIRVNAIAPGYMDTVLNAGDNLKVVRDIWAARCPMGRMGDVEEVTGPVILLCSSRAGRYMTGSEIVVDGGALCF